MTLLAVAFGLVGLAVCATVLVARMLLWAGSLIDHGWQNGRTR